MNPKPFRIPPRLVVCACLLIGVGGQFLFRGQSVLMQGLREASFLLPLPALLHQFLIWFLKKKRVRRAIKKRREASKIYSAQNAPPPRDTADRNKNLNDYDDWLPLVDSAISSGTYSIGTDPGFILWEDTPDRHKKIAALGTLVDGETFAEFRPDTAHSGKYLVTAPANASQDAQSLVAYLQTKYGYVAPPSDLG